MDRKRFALIRAVFFAVAAFTLGSPSVSTSSPVNPVLPQQKSMNANTYYVDDFYLFVEGRITRTPQGYTIQPSFFPYLKKEAFEPPATRSQEEKSLCKIEVVNRNGEKTVHLATLMYCPPGDDVMRAISAKNLPVGGTGSLDPVFCHITPKTQKINYFVGNILIKSIQRAKSPLKIVSFGKETGSQSFNSSAENGYFLFWDIKNVNDRIAVVRLDEKSSEDSTGWSMISFNRDTQGRLFLSPENIRSREKSVGYRLVATDGFHLQIWIEENLIPLPKRKTSYI
jgi:hypothetical protein